ncbi:mitochondrial fission process protein 1 [Coccinella septempunctata]|uniref:mitochondrial fission process protein 1 n=1 Tax=Coccinella septempunctata TaxID=41139 RepID=UPI001D05F756|nr:mitochondrial fission process protein 1 [Coccinella septempunctata]
MTLNEELDIYKDTPLRLLGYANEVGESFRHIIGRKWVNFSYGIATLYVIADTIDKTWKSYEKNKEDPKCFKKVTFQCVDTLTWQMLASVVIPGYTINRICALSTYLINKSNLVSKNACRIIVPGIALASIPFIIKPIDHGTDYLLDNSLRKIEI